MSQKFFAIPELQALDARTHQVRIPPQTDVPITPRIRRIMDTAAFRRLSSISQLGLVSHVYPAANHTRFEHSLGVFHTALQFLKRLAYDQRFEARVSVAQAEMFLVAALVHDIGHWPYCHPVEDLMLPDVPRHEHLARTFLLHDEFADLLRLDWEIDPLEMVRLLSREPMAPGLDVISSLLSGPIDVDKVDYLERDSLHAGVPYGRHFDRDRLIGSLCLNREGKGLALSEKGRTAAELMVVARYVMFSEVYWHHAVRSATAMFQRAFYSLRDRFDLQSFVVMTERQMVTALQTAGERSGAGELLDGLFGHHRRLHKCVLELNAWQHPGLHEQLSRRPYPWLVQCSDALAQELSRRIGRSVPATWLLLDAPPRKLEVQFEIDIQLAEPGQFLPLRDVSPLVRTLAFDQFDAVVKRVRLFVHPELRDELRGNMDWPGMLQACALACDQESS